ncbi:tyrosine-protein phosphatase [Lentibacillus sediminis]|uniref:tyrosine-protein phosphatase n=1 Tax=Lentibacillus sediminis TaxID=1940529 RepID=UPI000C1C21D6|nr:CpsB/CapC family capsule biosynthesis tyrosine phosphatase [Lentibacillus sediminis]
MIDINNHILPGMDDGAATLATTMEMASHAADNGITQIVATPSHQGGKYSNTKTDILGALNYVQSKLTDERTPIKILPGQVTRIYGDLLGDLKKGEILPLNETSHYVLLELPENHVPQYTIQLLFDMQIAGYMPILVHPERNLELRERPNLLHRLIMNGALAQLKATSLTGGAGKSTKRIAQQMLEANLVHFIASEARNAQQISALPEAYEEVRKQYGAQLLNQLMENANAATFGHYVEKEIPARIPARKQWKLFNR